jgi:hypothetical protein
MNTKTPIPFAMRIPVLSTAHMPDSAALDKLMQYDTEAVALYDGGGFVKLRPHAAYLDEFKWLAPIAFWAECNVFEWVRFDADGEEVLGLEVYDWEAGNGAALIFGTDLAAPGADRTATFTFTVPLTTPTQEEIDAFNTTLNAQRAVMADELKAMFVKPVPACNESISHGTHRTQDLIPRFLAVLEGLAPAAQCVQYCMLENSYYKSALVLGDSCNWWGSEDALELLEDLTDELNSYAPPGFYFGCHPGDGSDFGFWAISDAM